jgi:hypothetical protein
MSDETKKPFVSQEDRPEVKLSPDTPIGELRVRDLMTILGAAGSTKSPFENKTSLKDFFDKDFPEVAKDFIKEIKQEKIDKPELKELKGDKNEKFEKNEKLEKREKLEKPEIKELKIEKIEKGEVVTIDPRFPEPDPRFEQLIQAVAGLAKQVGDLTNQVEEMKKKGK